MLFRAVQSTNNAFPKFSERCECSEHRLAARCAACRRHLAEATRRRLAGSCLPGRRHRRSDSKNIFDYYCHAPLSYLTYNMIILILVYCFTRQMESIFQWPSLFWHDRPVQRVRTVNTGNLQQRRPMMVPHACDDWGEVVERIYVMLCNYTPF